MVGVIHVTMMVMSMAVMMIGDDTGAHRGQWVGVRAWEARGSGRMASSRARQPPTWGPTIHLGPPGSPPGSTWVLTQVLMAHLATFAASRRALRDILPPPA